MAEQNVNYIVPINFPELDLLEYCCERFNMALSDVWLVIIESAEYFCHVRSNIIDNGNMNGLPLILTENDYHNIINNDWGMGESLDILISEIVETMDIPFDQKDLFKILVDMQINFGSVNTHYTIDSNGVYDSIYEKHEVIKIIYGEVLYRALYEFDDKIINIVNLILAGYDVSLVDIIPDHVINNNNYYERLIIVYNINRKQ